MGSLEGYIDYKHREFCDDVECKVQVLLNEQEAGSSKYEEIRSICESNCIHSHYESHHWLVEKGYLLVRPSTSVRLTRENAH